MGLLAEAFGEGSILIKDSVDNRSAAIQLAGELLVQSGKAKASYVSSMLEAVERFGPYIVIAPGIALAHGKPSEDVIETGLSLLVLKQAIEFQHSQNDPVQLVSVPYVAQPPLHSTKGNPSDLPCCAARSMVVEPMQKVRELVAALSARHW